MDFLVVFLRQLSLDGRQCVGSGCQEFTVFSGTQRDFEQDVPVPQARLHTQSGHASVTKGASNFPR